LNNFSYFPSILIFLVIIIIGLAGAESSLADSRLDDFIHRLDATDARRLSFSKPDSAFYPYRYKSLELGLSGSDRAKLYGLQQSGNCDVQIYDFAIKGFFGHYPFLRPALDDLERRSKIESSIRSRAFTMFRRCYYFRCLHQLHQWYDVSTFYPVDVKDGFAPPDNDWSDPAAYFAWSKLRDIAYVLGDLAFCRDDPGSIRDAIEALRQPGGMIYSVKEALYLTGRASRLGLLSGVQLNEAIEGFRKKGMLLHDIRRIIAIARSQRINSSPEFVGDWQRLCAY